MFQSSWICYLSLKSCLQARMRKIKKIEKLLNQLGVNYKVEELKRKLLQNFNEVIKKKPLQISMQY